MRKCGILIFYSIAFLNFKLHFLAILNQIMLILTPLYLGNRGIKWVWKWSQIWISTTRSMSFTICKFWIFCPKLPKKAEIVQMVRKGVFDWKMVILTPLYLGNRGIKWWGRWCPFIILTSGSMTFRYPKCGYFGQKSHIWGTWKSYFQMSE